MIASLTINGITSSMTVDGGVKTVDFLRYVQQRLVPTLRQDDVVCWHNINMHKNANVVAAILDAGASILKLPRYSPDLNPIEAAWSKAKHLIRRYGPQTAGNSREQSAAACVESAHLMPWGGSDIAVIAFHFFDPGTSRRRVQQLSKRPECCGELIQVDGCDHKWFEAQAPTCTLPYRRRSGCLRGGFRRRLQVREDKMNAPSMSSTR